MANILEEVQRYVADKLNADEQLSGCTFLVENMKDIDYEIKKALGKQGLVGLVMTPKAVYQGKYEDLFLAWQLDELEINIVENPTINRDQLSNYITGQDAAMRLFDVLCPAVGDSEGQFNPVSYEEGEDSGLIVNKCILKALVYGESQDPPQPTPPLNMRFVKLLDEAPPLSVTRQEGWMWPTDDGYVIWQDGEPKPLGGGVSYDEMSAYVDQHLSDYLPLSGGTVNGDVNVKGDIAFVKNNNIMGMLTDNSGLYGKIDLSVALDDNYSASISPFGFIGVGNNGVTWPTEEGKFALTKEIPLSVSQLSNDSGFITSAEIEPYHYPLTPTVNTGIANKAFSLAVYSHDAKPIADARFAAQYTTDKDLTDKFSAGFSLLTYWPYNMTKYGEQTYDQALELKLCQDKLYFLTSRGQIQIYTGYMFRTKGVGFAVPCSEDGTPAGTLYEITSIETTNAHILVSSRTPHTIGFTASGNDQYGQITSLDGEEGTISAYRIGNQKTKRVGETVANTSDLPTKTSELSNDSGYITAQQVPTPSYIQDASGKRIEADLDYLSYDYTAPWTANNDFGDLTWDSENNNWSGIDEYDTTKLVLSWNEGSNQWELQIFDWVAGDWEYNSTETKSGAYEDITVVFQSYTCTRTIAMTDKLALSSDIPTKTSDLVNDAGYITSAYPVKNDGGIQKAVAMTEAQYEAISATADLSTLYVITED